MIEMKKAQQVTKAIKNRRDSSGISKIVALLNFIGYSGHIVPVIPGMLCHWKQM